MNISQLHDLGLNNHKKIYYKLPEIKMREDLKKSKNELIDELKQLRKEAAEAERLACAA